MLSEQIAHTAARPAAGGEGETEADSLDLPAQLEAVERRLIERALRRAGGNQSKAARLLQISRNGLAKRLKRLGIRVTESQEG